MLQQAGYQTAMVGKWHLKSPPTGFDYWNVLPGQGVYDNPILIEMGQEKQHQGYVTDIITDLAMSWVRGRDAEKPFLLLYHHKAPHAQWVPSAEHDRLFEGETISPPANYDDDSSARATPVQQATNRLVPDLLGRWRTWGAELRKEDPGELEGDALKDWMYQQYVKDYMRVMVSVDENVGRFLDFLDAEGLAENTMVIYTSDNGMFIGDHSMFDKRLMDEESLRIPLAIRYPGVIAAGSETDAFSLNVDYAPTILDFAEVPIPGDMQGRSLRPIVEGRLPDDWCQSFYYHYYEAQEFQYQGVSRALRHPHRSLQADPLLHGWKGGPGGLGAPGSRGRSEGVSEPLHRPRLRRDRDRAAKPLAAPASRVGGPGGLVALSVRLMDLRGSNGSYATRTLETLV